MKESDDTDFEDEDEDANNSNSGLTFFAIIISTFILLVIFYFFLSMLVVIEKTEVDVNKSDDQLLIEKCNEFVKLKLDDVRNDQNIYKNEPLNFAISSDIDYVNKQCCFRVHVDFTDGAVDYNALLDLQQKYYFDKCILFDQNA